MDATLQSKAKLGLEKQEHLVKLAILTIAAILCKSNTHFSLYIKQQQKLLSLINIEVINAYIHWEEKNQ